MGRKTSNLSDNSLTEKPNLTPPAGGYLNVSGAGKSGCGFGYCNKAQAYRMVDGYVSNDSVEVLSQC